MPELTAVEDFDDGTSMTMLDASAQIDPRTGKPLQQQQQQLGSGSGSGSAGAGSTFASLVAAENASSYHLSKTSSAKKGNIMATLNGYGALTVKRKSNVAVASNEAATAASASSTSDPRRGTVSPRLSVVATDARRGSVSPRLANAAAAAGGSGSDPRRGSTPPPTVVTAWGEASLNSGSSSTVRRASENGSGSGQVARSDLLLDSVGKSIVQPAEIELTKAGDLEAEAQRDRDDSEMALAAAVQGTVQAKRKISRVYGKAEDLVTELMKAHMGSQENYVATMRMMVDEYAKVCQTVHLEPFASDETETPQQRFVRLIDEYHHVLQYELIGHHEEVNRINAKLDALQRGMYKRGVLIATAMQNGGPSTFPNGVSLASARTVMDLGQGLIVQFWEHAHTAAKYYVKSLSRFVNLVRNPFHTPCVVLFELCGMAYTVSTIAPIYTLVRDPFRNTEFRFGVEAATAELNIELDAEAAIRRTVFGSGADGRRYCLMAYGLVPVKYHPNFLNVLNPADTNDADALEQKLIQRVDHAAVEAVAVCRSNLAQISKALHRHALRVEHIGLVHAYLSRQETARQSAPGTHADPNLAAALIATNAEILARTLKVVLRRLWADNIAVNPKIAQADRPREMAIFAHQLVNLLISDHESRAGDDHQLFHKVAEISRRTMPVDSKTLKKTQLCWDAEYISESHIASRIAHMTGLRFVQGVLCGIAAGRFVRGIRIEPREMWIEVQRGRHQEVMKRLVAQIKNVRGSQSYRAFHLTVTLADVFHQAQGRPGVTRSASDLFDQAAWRKRNPKPEDLSKSQMQGKDGAELPADDEAYLTLREVHLMKILACQAVATARRDIIVAEAAARDRAGHSQSHIQGASGSQSRDDRFSIGNGTTNAGESSTSRTPEHTLNGRSLQSSPRSRGQMAALMLPAPANEIPHVTSDNTLDAVAGGSTTGLSTNASPAGSPSGALGRIPSGAKASHVNALASVTNYIRRSVEVTKDTTGGADAKIEDVYTVEGLRERQAQSQMLHETLNRVEVLYQASSVLKDKSIPDMINSCMRTLDRYRRLRLLDPKVGVAVWNCLFDALMHAQTALDADAAIKAGYAKLAHAEKLWGPLSPLAAIVHSDIGSTLLSLGMAPDGRREFEVGFRMLTQVAPLSSATFTAANNLGFTYFKLAEKSLDPAARKRRHSFLKMKLPLAVCAQLDEAAAAFTFVIDNAAYAAMATVADALNNLGSVNAFRGRYGVAVPLYERSLTMTRGIFADDHPDRASAIRNLRTCERRLRSNAALWIICLFKRFRARKQLDLLKKGALHVTRFQRLGRAYLGRQRMYQLSEIRRLRQIGVGVYAGGAASFFVEEVESFGNTNQLGRTLPVPGILLPANSPAPAARLQPMLQSALPSAAPSPFASPPPQSAMNAPLNAPDELLSPSRANALDSLMAAKATESAAAVALTPSQRAALVVLQGCGRGCLTRNMLRKLHAFRLKKRAKGK